LLIGTKTFRPPCLFVFVLILPRSLSLKKVTLAASTIAEIYNQCSNIAAPFMAKKLTRTFYASVNTDKDTIQTQL
jgi:hypothetical protein